MSTNTTTLASDAVVLYSMNEFRKPERERGDDGARELAEPADDDDEERVDDVALPDASGRSTRSASGHAGDAGEARADEERGDVGRAS